MAAQVGSGRSRDTSASIGLTAPVFSLLSDVSLAKRTLCLGGDSALVSPTNVDSVMSVRGRGEGARPSDLPARRIVLGVLIAILLAAAGCADTARPSVGTPTTSGPASESADVSVEQSVLAAYEGMWRAYAKAGLTANPDEPALSRYTAGKALQTLTDGLAGYRKDGQILKGDLVTRPRVEQASPGANARSMTVTDCLDTTNFLVYSRSGEPADDAPGGRRFTRATVTDLGTEGWKVTSFGVQAVGTC